MKKNFFSNYAKLLAIFCGISSSLCAQDTPADIYSELSVDAGFHHGHIKRDIGIDMLLSNNIPIEGTLKHKTKFRLWDIQATSRTIVDNIYIKANAGYGCLVNSTEMIDADNLNFNKRPFSSYLTTHGQRLTWGRVRKSKKHGHAFNANAAIGYVIPLNASVQFIPMVGLSHREMIFKKYDNDTSMGTVSSNVKQKERWSGPFVALEMPMTFENGVTLVLNGEYHFAKYKNSSSSPNKGNDYRYYYSGAKRGSIIVGGVKCFFALNNRCKINFAYSIHSARARPNFKTTYNSTGAPDHYIRKTKKGKVSHIEHSWQAGLTWLF